jgi:hypothetical protein
VKKPVKTKDTPPQLADHKPGHAAHASAEAHAHSGAQEAARPGTETPAPAPGSKAHADKHAVVASDVLKLSLPLPAELQPDALATATVVVKSRPATGRRRAGFGFTHEPTRIPFGDLSAEQLKALETDAQLDVSVEVPKPA